MGALALSGIFPLSGFFSKDEILLAIKLAAHEGGSIYILIYWVAVFTAFLTAFYTGRAFFMTFWGTEKLPSPDDPEAPPIVAAADAHAHPGGHGGDDHGHADADSHGHGSHVGHESPPIMTLPALCPRRLHGLDRTGLFVGRSVLGHDRVVCPPPARTLGFESLKHEEHHFDWLTAIVGTVAGVGGLALSYRMYAAA